MLDLIKYIVNTFAEKKDEVEYKVEEKETAIEVTVLLADNLAHIACGEKDGHFNGVLLFFYLVLDFVLALGKGVYDILD